MNQQTRDLIHIKGISIWLKADVEVLLRRTRRRSDRPLAERMKELLPQREPVYAQSDIVVQSRDEPHDTIVDEVIEGVAKHLGVAGHSKEPS
jgi:shikimate kinase